MEIYSKDWFIDRVKATWKLWFSRRIVVFFDPESLPKEGDTLTIQNMKCVFKKSTK